MPQLALTLDLDGLDAERVEEACFEFGARRGLVHRPARRSDARARARRIPALAALAPAGAVSVRHVAGGARRGPVARAARRAGALHRSRRWPTASGNANGCATSIPCVSAGGCGSRRIMQHVHTEGAVIVRLDPGPRVRHRHPRHHGDVPGLARRTRRARASSPSTTAAARACWRWPPSKLGARAAYAFDIDPQALTATRDNAAANDVAAQVHVVDDGRDAAARAPTSCWLTSCAARCASSRRASPR